VNPAFGSGLTVTPPAPSEGRYSGGSRGRIILRELHTTFIDIFIGIVFKRE
jgi:hypothetical protein